MWLAPGGFLIALLLTSTKMYVKKDGRLHKLHPDDIIMSIGLFAELVLWPTSKLHWSDVVGLTPLALHGAHYNVLT